jgi:hypothetical protein
VVSATDPHGRILGFVVSAMDPHGRILGFIDRKRKNKYSSLSRSLRLFKSKITYIINTMTSLRKLKLMQNNHDSS